MLLFVSMFSILWDFSMNSVAKALLASLFSNTSSIVWICLAVHKMLANKAFTVTDGLIFLLFVVAFVHPVYIQIVLI